MMSRHPDLESMYSSLQQTYGINTFISEEQKVYIFSFYQNYVELDVILFISKLPVMGNRNWSIEHFVYLLLVNQGHHWHHDWIDLVRIHRKSYLLLCNVLLEKRQMFWKLKWLCAPSSSLSTHYSVTKLDPSHPAYGIKCDWICVDNTVIFDLY